MGSDLTSIRPLFKVNDIEMTRTPTGWILLEGVLILIVYFFEMAYFFLSKRIEKHKNNIKNLEKNKIFYL